MRVALRAQSVARRWKTASHKPLRDSLIWSPRHLFEPVPVRWETSMRWTRRLLTVLTLLSLGCARGDIHQGQRLSGPVTPRTSETQKCQNGQEPSCPSHASLPAHWHRFEEVSRRPY